LLLRKNLKNLTLNIPNLLSISRLFLVFQLILFLEINRPFYVFILIIIGGLTDYFDGLIARKFNLKTRLGAILDPLSDKVFYLIPFTFLCKNNIIASDKQLISCIDCAYIKNLPLPTKPSFVEFYIVYVSSFLKFHFGIIIQQLPFSKKVRYYEREMKLIFDKCNLEKIKKIKN